MDEILQRIYEIGIVPVIAINDADKAVDLAKALVNGGLPVAEVTFRTPEAKKAIENISKEVPQMLVGAGTVLTKKQVDEAANAGSKFIVSPGFNPEVTKYALEKGLNFMPGTATAGEMEQAMALGLNAVKFFPAEQNGGVEKLKSLSGPYTSLRWMPTGGINAGNLNNYLSFDKIIACGGTWMVKADLINSSDWAEITRLSREAVNNMLAFKIRHIGINCESNIEAINSAELLKGMFGFGYSIGNSSIFSADNSIELMKSPFKGKFGHIAIETNTIDRAIAHLKMRGFEFEESSRVVKNNKTKSIYLKRELCGFAIHLLQK